MIFWDGTGLVLIMKRLEDHIFTWPTTTNEAFSLSLAQFQALFEGTDWRRVVPLNTKTPQAFNE